jgi:hypothetical protein
MKGEPMNRQECLATIKQTFSRGFHGHTKEARIRKTILKDLFVALSEEFEVLNMWALLGLKRTELSELALVELRAEAKDLLEALGSSPAWTVVRRVRSAVAHLEALGQAPASTAPAAEKPA